MFSGQFQTPADPDIGPGILTGTITGMTVLDPTESYPPGEKTSLLEPDDPFNVQLDWKLSGPLVWVVGGTWHLRLFIDDVDGVGPTHGQLGSTVNIPVVITGDPTPFSYTFQVAANTVKEGVYRLTAVINHTPAGAPANSTYYTEMVGFAESSPVDFTKTPAESN
jgi:hypothetical protein